MDEKTLVDKLSKVTTITDLQEVAKEVGKPMTVEQADKALNRLFGAENDTGELMGDSVAKAAKDIFG
ncbi:MULTISPECIES: hypothetical protein [unclassified Bifidobacterium]|uniref:hypothetical protein n=1 Tax=unclassified Bifidobacterium TaxID=2608897 RepID=UPI0023F7CECD|nr:MULTISPECIES: hypothetical protein [unclassified Bifidobacterium]MDF7640536.1 hypothetical protein [Bifidobacterium sp. ESL0784]MDF7664583.1 hypothetical protein [Bifidobacterium sp. ESL0745]WEV63692.1 hypothetical protein OZX70_07045 [Bifidobacterium sp. ESL0732]